MKMTINPQDRTSRVEVFVSEKNCLQRALSILDCLVQMSVPDAEEAAKALAKVIERVSVPAKKAAEEKKPENSQLAISPDDAPVKTAAAT